MGDLTLAVVIFGDEGEAWNLRHRREGAGEMIAATGFRGETVDLVGSRFGSPGFRELVTSAKIVPIFLKRLDDYERAERQSLGDS